MCVHAACAVVASSILLCLHLLMGCPIQLHLPTMQSSQAQGLQNLGRKASKTLDARPPKPWTQSLQNLGRKASNNVLCPLSLGTHLSRRWKAATSGRCQGGCLSTCSPRKLMLISCTPRTKSGREMPAHRPARPAGGAHTYYTVYQPLLRVLMQTTCSHKGWTSRSINASFQSRARRMQARSNAYSN